MKTKKELKAAYKSMTFRCGIFQICNIHSGKRYLNISHDLDRPFHSDLFQLKAGLHAISGLQEDWNLQGAPGFRFEILDELKVEAELSPEKIQKELQALLELHKADIKVKDLPLYN